MSMNIHLSATVTATLPDGSPREICEEFNCVQTPTKDTYNILKQPDIEAAYREWVKTTFAMDSEIWISEHFAALEEFLTNHPTASGWVIEWYDL